MWRVRKQGGAAQATLPAPFSHLGPDQAPLLVQMPPRLLIALGWGVAGGSSSGHSGASTAPPSAFLPRPRTLLCAHWAAPCPPTLHCHLVGALSNATCSRSLSLSLCPGLALITEQTPTHTRARTRAHAHTRRAHVLVRSRSLLLGELLGPGAERLCAPLPEKAWIQVHEGPSVFAERKTQAPPRAHRARGT